MLSESRYVTYFLFLLLSTRTAMNLKMSGGFAADIFPRGYATERAGCPQGERGSIASENSRWEFER